MAEKVLIYGGTGGIGSAVARKLHERGVDLHLSARGEESLETLASELGAGYTAGDVTETGFFEKVSADAGEVLSGLVYAVGTINLRSFPRLTQDDYMQDFQVNALGAALAVQAALPALKKAEKPASVVLFTSVAVLQGFTFHASVGMAKGAVMGLVHSLAAELSPDVRVNAIAPSLVDTPLAERFFRNEKMIESLAGMHAMQRLGTPEDIASMADFLLSSESGWITGQVLGVDGGRSTLRTKS